LRSSCGSIAAMMLDAGYSMQDAGQAPLLAGAARQSRIENLKSKIQNPNILWVSCEDISPDLGCYGDRYAVTPNIDKLAAEGVRYTNVYTNAGVCAPSRSGIITGMYPTTIGTHHMRCKGVPPAEVKCFSEYLRKAGYYCTNNVKTDYQFDPPMTAWDESSKKAHWRGRTEGQPFFAVFNFTISHESKIRDRSKGMLKRLAALKPHEKHDPAKIRRRDLPPYYPDTPVVRKDWAQYYDIITLMDKQVGDILRQLEEDGLAEDTIVWFWGDHGRGLPRAKRWVYDSGIHVPLIIRVPDKWRKLAMPDNPNALRPGTVNDDLIAFIDFAPTMLSLAGVKIPEHIQGRAFLGSQKAKPREYIFAARDRMDEAYDIIRAVRDKRYKYIRNYMPHLPRSQDIEYMNQMPTMQEMRRLNAEGKLKGPQIQYFEPTKPVEELYDTVADPHEVKNLAGVPKYKNVLERMRKVHQEWMRQTSDVGLIPEPQFDEMKRPGGKWQKTAEPMFFQAAKTDENYAPVTLFCPTAGASIAYRIDARPERSRGDGSNKKRPWKVYAKPVLLKSGQVLQAQACRIGFRDSEKVMFKLGDPITGSKGAEGSRKAGSQIIPHWTEQLNQTDLLERLRMIKDLDGLGEEAIPGYMEALRDEYGSVRYWAVVGLHNSCQEHQDMEQVKIALTRALEDPAPVVRIAAAHALCDWGQEKEALPVLLEALKCETDKARLYAMIAIKRIGEKARPALSAIKAGLKDKDNYVQRVTRAVLKQLENR
ncbi:MAG: sulfatase-like hydrolase/transferase, partial [Sedimentisphaerales bacterium]